ncbi:MAG: phage tail tape measure protein, partial [Pedobacter sp.]
MAKSNGGGLNFVAKLDTSQAIKEANNLEKVLGRLGVSLSNSTANSSSSANFVAAQQRMGEAMKASLEKTQQLTQENLKLRNEYEKGRISAQQLAAQLKATNQARKEEVAQQKAARQAQVAAVGSYAEAQARLKALGLELRNVTGGLSGFGAAQQARIREYRQLNAQLLQFDRALGNHQRNVGNYGGILGGIGQQLTGLASSFLSAYAVLGVVNKVIDSNAKISDSLSDVRRTAGLTANEADRLVASLKKIDTRSDLKGLVDIAIIGGQMGIAKDQLVGFTKAVDQLAVTLSGEISGGAEAVASALGKINGVFKVQAKEGTDVETSLNKTGSAILKLGQIGLATGDFLQDYALRTAGVAQAAKISLPTMLAYGATLEEAGISAEVAGTATVRLISVLASKREKFFAIAQLADSSLTLKQFTKLINTDAQGALDMFFKGLNSGNPSMTQFTDRIGTIGLVAGPSKNAIIALAQNQEKLSQRVRESTQAYDDGSLAVEQFALKNENLAASLDKLGNSLTNISTNPNSNTGKFLKFLTDAVTDAIGELDKLVARLNIAGKVINTFFAYNGDLSIVT